MKLGHPRIALAALPAAGLLALSLAACGPEQPGPTPTGGTNSATVSPGAHNEADARFMAQLAQLSQQAIAISQAVQARLPDGQDGTGVTDAIRLNDERLTLARQLLLTWGVAGAEAPEAPGLLTEQQFDEVIVASPAELSTQVNAAGAQLLGGLVVIAEAELRDGQNPTARRQAESILADPRSPVPSV